MRSNTPHAALCLLPVKGSKMFPAIDMTLLGQSFKRTRSFYTVTKSRR